jgi:hypothetical protein
MTNDIHNLYIERLRKQRVDIANVILDIIDCEKRFVDIDNDQGDTEELRMQLREVAFALINNKPVTPDQLT